VLSNRKGVFLLESVLAVLIMSVGLVVILKGMIQSAVVSEKTSFYYQALSKAEAEMTSVFFKDFMGVEIESSASFVEADQRYQILVRKEKADEFSDQLEKVDLTVVSEEASKRLALQISTYVFKANEKE